MKIHKLNPEIISQIAAGEVVNRPLNIVKELVENAIDAEADQILVTIQDGGLQQIKVQDNGFGIPGEELEIAFDLHTTSKLTTNSIEDVASLGFRGEALASIASVCIIDCISKVSSEKQATRILIEGGQKKSITTINGETGTTITVSGIFFNTPARRKFLKSAATERKRIIDLMSHYALMYPEIHFKLSEISEKGKITTRMESPSRKSLLASIYDILGHEIANNLVPVDATIGNWHLTGYISKPTLTRSDRSMQFINVNGRPIYHLQLQKTIEETYGSQLLKRHHPLIIIKLTGATNSVDFNVHPQKSEIRFSKTDTIIKELPDAILNTLKQNASLPDIEQVKRKKISNKHNQVITGEKSGISSISHDKGETTVKPPAVTQKQIKQSQSTQTIQKSLFDDIIIDETSDKLVLGHIFNKFGIVFRNNELWLVDLHAADERVKFEFFAQSAHRKASSQQLLTPLSITLSSAEVLLLIDNKDLLGKYGLKISHGGTTSVLVHSVPVYYDQEISVNSIKSMLIDMIGYLNQDYQSVPVESPFDAIEYAIVSRLACHGAVRSGYPVGKEKINQIIKNLLACEYPWTCAHGRPTAIRMTKQYIERLFNR